MNPLLIAALAVSAQPNWLPARDNPVFSPLRPGDPHASGAPLCEARDSHGAALISYGEEDETAAMRILGRLVIFRKAEFVADVEHGFASPEGEVVLVFGEDVATGHEYSASRGTLTFTDLRGRAHSAEVRIDCGA